MRIAALTPVALLSAALLLPGAPQAAPPPNPHVITCASPRALREYESGLRAFHLRQYEAAAKEFREALKRDPSCAMAQWGLSRALHKGGKTEEALAALTQAEALSKLVEDREQRMIAAWAKELKAAGKPEGERRNARNQIRNDLNLALALYADDPELWLQRGDAEENPLRAGPFYLAALRVQPAHPFSTVWKPTVPAVPEVKPAATNPIPAIQPAPPLFEGLGMLAHPMTTSNPQAQAYYEQGLRTWHAYVSPPYVKNGAYQNFQHAANLDPEAAMPYWGLSLCATGSTPLKPLDCANRALELAQKKGTDKERRFAAARLLELTGSKREEFLDALDAAILAYPDDVELWIWRGKTLGTGLGCIPYQQAAYRIQPQHPAPNHEMVHAYEGIDRPALGWPYTEGFRKSAPNMPHANHMQAHLAMRIGRWQEAVDCTRTSRRKSLEGFPELDASHHIDVMIRALSRMGHFKEAEAEPQAYRNGLPWARLIQLKADPEELDRWAQGRGNSPEGQYVAAIAKLDKYDLAGAEPLVAKVEEQWKKNPSNNYRYNEVKGRYLVLTGQPDEGLKLLKEIAQKAVKDSGLHSWGGGSYVLEVWGEAALRARRWDEAEEAFHEALAHEHGSILGALGMQVVWEQRGRPEMAAHYAARAAETWKSADPGYRERHLERLRKLAAGSVAQSRP